MFREMRNKKRQVSKEEVEAILTKGEYGTLATVDEEGQPYAVPLSYSYLNGHIYFHCAGKGQKLDNIKHNSKVSFSVVGDTELYPEKFSTHYESVICFGKTEFVVGEEKIQGLISLIEKYSPAFMKEGKAYIDKAAGVTTVVRINIDHMTGKASR